MTFEKKVALVEQFCNEQNGKCGRCPAEGDNTALCEKYAYFGQATEEELDRFIKAYMEGCAEEKEQTPEHDVVNHPSHYCREGAMESIEEMLLLFGKEAVKHFCLLNAWKYRYRAADKNGEEDLKKSDWYIKKYWELTYDEHGV